MDNNKIYEKVKMKIAISKSKEEDIVMEKNNVIKYIVATLLMITSFSGVVFAKDISEKIYENFFLTGKGMETAMNEGYIENIEMEEKISNTIAENEETGKKIEDTNTKIKIENFVMDDFNLSMIINVTLSDKINEIIKPQDIWEMNFPDLVITDEENNKVVKNSGLNCFIQNRGNNPVKVVYNYYTGGDEVYPKSKKLNFNMTQIKISDKDETLMGEEEITLTGNWNFEIDVPEKMYNRKNTIYKQVSTTNSEFNVLEAKVYETGTDLKLKFKGEKRPKAPTLPEIEFWESLPQDDELKNIDILNYFENKIRKTDEYREYLTKSFEVWNYEKYIKNENGKRFNMTESPRENGGGSIDDDGYIESSCTFDLTKYDLTDKITVYIDYHGNKAEIVLEKVGDK